MAERSLTGDLPSANDSHPLGFDMSNVRLVDVFKSRTKGDVFSPKAASSRLTSLSRGFCPRCDFEAFLIWSTVSRR